MYNGRDARIQEELLIWGDTGVCDGPAQHACFHILSEAPVVVSIVQTYPPIVLEASCTAQVASMTVLDRKSTFVISAGVDWPVDNPQTPSASCVGAVRASCIGRA